MESNLTDITVYIPTKAHLSLALDQGKRLKHALHNPLGCSELIRDPSSVQEQIFNEAMTFKKEIGDIVNQELYSKFCVLATNLRH